MNCTTTSSGTQPEGFRRSDKSKGGLHSATLRLRSRSSSKAPPQRHYRRIEPEGKGVLIHRRTTQKFMLSSNLVR
jgi:hypothetical protein